MEKLQNLIAFCALMEADGGIIDKSPDYVAEKFMRYVGSMREDEWLWGLDMSNQELVNQWFLKWTKRDAKKELLEKANQELAQTNKVGEKSTEIGTKTNEVV